MFSLGKFDVEKFHVICSHVDFQLSWKNAICAEWFACMSQKSVTTACAQRYIATISRLSHKLLDIVINLQDNQVRVKGNFCSALQQLAVAVLKVHNSNF